MGLGGRVSVGSTPLILDSVLTGSTVVTQVGSNLQWSSGELALVTASTDNLAFAGIATKKHETGDADLKMSYIVPDGRTIVEVDLDAATDITNQDELQLNNATTFKKSSTDPVAVAVETKAAATRIKCRLYLPATVVGDAS